MLERMYAALEGLRAAGRRGDAGDWCARYAASTRQFLDAVRRDCRVAQGAIGLVLDQPAISSLLVDNLNATIHLRALLTDLFLIDQARKGVDPS